MQALYEGDRERHLVFILGKMKVDYSFVSHLVMSGKATFRLNGKELEFHLTPIIIINLRIGYKATSWNCRTCERLAEIQMCSVTVSQKRVGLLIC